VNEASRKFPPKWSLDGAPLGKILPRFVEGFRNAGSLEFVRDDNSKREAAIGMNQQG